MHLNFKKGFFSVATALELTSIMEVNLKLWKWLEALQCMTVAKLTYKLTTSQSHKIRVEVTRSLKMQTSWKGISTNGVLHLVEDYTSQEQRWFSLCGRKGLKKQTESLDKVQGGDTCCSVCVAMQRRKIKSQPLLEANFKVF